jgi:hypothetical protein
LAVEFSVKHLESYFEITVTGPADHNKYARLMDSLFAHEKWKPGTPILIDEIALDASEISVAEVSTIAEECGRRRSEFGEARMALLVARELEFGMNRMWSVFVEDKCDVIINVLYSRQEAIDWLLV